MKRVILSGGGTGGHIYPAITIAKEIAKLEETEFLFVGTPNGMESRIIPKEGYRFASLPASGLKRKLTLENASAAERSRYLDAKREKFKSISKTNKTNRKSGS